jgi:hypothetical protein
MEEEIFLNTSLSNFKNEEKRILNQGYQEKKFTKSTKKEIEDAFKRHLLKQLIRERGIRTPKEINELTNEIASMIPDMLYTTGITGETFLKYKMYSPSLELRRNMEGRIMETNYEEVEEFAPENIAERLNALEQARNAVIMKNNTNNINSRNKRASKYATTIRDEIAKISKHIDSTIKNTIEINSKLTKYPQMLENKNIDNVISETKNKIEYLHGLWSGMIDVPPPPQKHKKALNMRNTRRKAAQTLKNRPVYDRPYKNKMMQMIRRKKNLASTRKRLAIPGMNNKNK